MIDSIYFPEPLPINPGRSQSQPQPAQPAGKPGGFARILDGKLPAQEVKFSSHAQQRLQSRGITFSDTDLKRLEGAVESVAQKGGRESLIMLGDAALVVSVRNRAMDRASMQGNVFTNIDSAVII